MEILSHRGLWKSFQEKNTRTAFERSFRRGFGTETDVRDHNGRIVISHDMPSGNELSLLQLLDIASEFSSVEKRLTLALNVKADGLQEEIASIMNQFTNINYFVFDMSIPDMRGYIRSHLPIFTRYSEVETVPIYLEEVEGVWLDNFSKKVWYDEEVLIKLLMKKKVCVVSPDLHNNNPEEVWGLLLPFQTSQNLILCTDKPEEALKFFVENKHEKV